MKAVVKRGAVDLDAVMSGGIALREMLGHGRLWDEEMNAAAQGEK